MSLRLTQPSSSKMACSLHLACVRLLDASSKLTFSGSFTSLPALQPTLVKVTMSSCVVPWPHMPIFLTQLIRSFKAGRAANIFSKCPNSMKLSIGLLDHFSTSSIHKPPQTSSSKYSLNRNNWNLSSLEFAEVSKSCTEFIAKQVIELDPWLNLLQTYGTMFNSLF